MGVRGAERDGGWWFLSSEYLTESISPTLFSEVANCSFNKLSISDYTSVRQEYKLFCRGELCKT